MVLSCSDEKINTPVSQRQLVKDQNNQLTEKPNTVEHWLVDAEGNIKPETSDIHRQLDDQEVSLLEADRKEMEVGLQELIQEMDDNLDNPPARQEIKEKMQYSTVEYKQKMLLLAKDQLKKQ